MTADKEPDGGCPFIISSIENCENIVTYFFKARTLQPEKQPLLANDPETTFFYKQRP
jgi:hypothetical protein